MEKPEYINDEEILKHYDKMLKAVREFDDEVAHICEDRLRHRALELIANGYENSEGFARWALQTSKLDFERWRA